jgi:hypothetical protein
MAGPPEAMRWGSRSSEPTQTVSLMEIAWGGTALVQTSQGPALDGADPRAANLGAGPPSKIPFSSSAGSGSQAPDGMASWSLRPAGRRVQLPSVRSHESAPTWTPRGRVG